MPAAKATTISDNFPGALSSYSYGGWQGPFGYGGAGRLFPNPDGSGVYMKATYNGYVWAARSSPEFTGIDMTMRFTIPNRDNTDADAFGLQLLYHTPVTPAGGICTSSGPTMCSGVTAESGLKLYYRIGNNQLYINLFANGQQSPLNQLSVPTVTLNQPHDLRAAYSSGNLALYLDGVQLVSMQTPNVPAGQIGFEAYRTDLILNTLTLVGAETQRLSISLTGSFDYLLQETVPAQIAALVTDASTGQPISLANVTIQIVDSSGNTIIPSTTMQEKPVGTGVYVWTSNSTLQRLHLLKGIYLATVTASLTGAPSAQAILSFHIDPPVGAASEPSLSLPWIIAVTALAASSATIILSTGLQRFRHSRQEIQNTPSWPGLHLGHQLQSSTLFLDIVPVHRTGSKSGSTQPSRALSELKVSERQ